MALKNILHRLRIKIQDFLFQSPLIYKQYLGGEIKPDYNILNEIKGNVVLKEQIDIDNYSSIIEDLGLPERSDKSKNWDTLIAYAEVLKNTNKDAVILDAGAEVYSMLLPWLFLSGYKHLFGINIVFSKKFQRGSIKYEYGDITKTSFPNNHFDAIACLSVIEHGVNTERFLEEMNRILKPNGLLILSTDYFETKINTTDKIAYGTHIKIFSKKEIEKLILEAEKYNLINSSKPNLESLNKPVRWERFDLDYTYICLTFKNKK